MVRESGEDNPGESGKEHNENAGTIKHLIMKDTEAVKPVYHMEFPSDISDDEFMDAFMGMRFAFGLKAQGHVPTIEARLLEGRSWEEIAKEIGWEPKTLEDHWGWLQAVDPEFD